MFGSLAPGMPKLKSPKPKKPRKWKPPAMAKAGVAPHPMANAPAEQNGADEPEMLSWAEDK